MMRQIRELPSPSREALWGGKTGGLLGALAVAIYFMATRGSYGGMVSIYIPGVLGIVGGIAAGLVVGSVMRHSLSSQRRPMAAFSIGLSLGTVLGALIAFVCLAAI
jgi:hypothetical protein